MATIKTYEMDFGGKLLTIEIGRFAAQADGACVVRHGDTMVLATAVMGKDERPDLGYFPLLVDYEERMYAAGKISGSRFVKREGRPTEEAVLTTRLVDRSVRPLFNDAMRRDVQVVITVLSVDGENDPDIPAVIAAATALTISPIPWNGPLGAVRVTSSNGGFQLNSNYTEREAADVDVFVSGTGEQVVMIEAEGKQCPEDKIERSIGMALTALDPVVKLIQKIQKEVGKEKVAIQVHEEPSEVSNARQQIQKLVSSVDFSPTISVTKKTEREAALVDLKEKFVKQCEEKALGDYTSIAKTLFEHAYDAWARELLLTTGKRVDGRGTDEIRPIVAEVGLVPRIHGSGMFHRGETQVLSIVTLGAPGSEQLLDGMEVEGKKRYMHHYNFPGFSVGEVAPVRGASRREIGHGALAEKALRVVIPPKETFPYTIRVVSEVLESNGSSSQASVCGSTLALMDAGVPISDPVAGIAMGLATSDDGAKHVVLTDIQGVEDHAFDMDFKIAGTRKGVTAIQLDIKVTGISMEVVRETLARGKKAREEILNIMAEVIKAPRKELSPFAPRIESIQLNSDQVRGLIGPGGKMINKIIDATGVQIDIEDSGLVHVTSVDLDSLSSAIKMISDVTREIKIGEIFEGTVTEIIRGRMNDEEIGAIVELVPGKEGMVHVSQISWEHVAKVSDALQIGDKVRVKVMGVDLARGRIELSMKELEEKPEGYVEPPRGPRRPSGGRFQRNFHDRGRSSGFRPRSDGDPSRPRPIPRRKVY
ncbi:MAG: polyribonucleotide nucleotidyltransferase [Candidatus Kerfeldbacteria bacterium]|nr:polyribonucleotide nucleotidyltransferase [Candidatus Kerfeldbacteria bacterium]